jgi:hypothetical protein
MKRVLLALAVIVTAACHGKRTQPAPVADAARSAIVVRDASAVAPARFSRPVAAGHASSGVTFVAGLVAARGVVAITALAPDGATLWTRDAITGVTWSSNATVAVIPSPRGAFVVWRGPRANLDVTTAASFDGEGNALEEPFTVGAAACATDSELAWAERGTKGTWLVKARAFGATTQTTAIAVPEERDPVVLCGAHRLFAFGDGDDDVTLTSWERGVRAPSLRVMEDVEFGSDEERGHEVYAVGDVVGIVRVGAGGSVTAREVTGDKRSAWRHLGRKLTEGDDVTLVDADARMAILAFTRDTSAPGDVVSQSSVLVLAWERAGTGDWTNELAPSDALRTRGPFWSGAVAGGVVVGWAERSARADAGAPVVGMAYRLVSSEPTGSLGELRRVDRPADDLVDAGCDDAHCYAVALARRAGEDGGQPEVAEVLRYP